MRLNSFERDDDTALTAHTHTHADGHKDTGNMLKIAKSVCRFFDINTKISLWGCTDI